MARKGQLVSGHDGKLFVLLLSRNGRRAKWFRSLCGGCKLAEGVSLASPSGASAPSSALKATACCLISSSLVLPARFPADGFASRAVFQLFPYPSDLPPSSAHGCEELACDVFALPAHAVGGKGRSIIGGEFLDPFTGELVLYIEGFPGLF